MWSFGYTDTIGDNGPVETVWGEETTFSAAIRQLRENVLFEAKEADESESEAYEVLIADISDIADDPGIMDDPDQWEEEDFFLQNNSLRSYWVVTD